MTDEAIWSVYTAFAETDYGRRLSDSIRYEKYNLAELSNDEWVRLLGADVNNLAHMPLTYHCTKSFIRLHDEWAPGTLSPADASELKLAAIVHDQGEAIKGDISFGDKTEQDEADEQQAVIDHILPLVPSALRDPIERAFQEVVFDRFTDLGTMFNAIERVGYMRTALRASDRLLERRMPVIQEGLRWLVADVLGNQPPALLAAANKFPVVQVYLGANQDRITAAYELPQDSDFANYNAFAETKKTAYEAAKLEWLSTTVTEQLLGQPTRL